MNYLLLIIEENKNAMFNSTSNKINHCFLIDEINPLHTLISTFVEKSILNANTIYQISFHQISLLQVHDANHSYSMTGSILADFFVQTKSLRLSTAFDKIDFHTTCQSDKSNPMWNPMVIGVNEALPAHMQCLDGNDLRLLNIWKLICFSASTAQLAYVLESPNQLRATLGSDTEFNEKYNLMNGSMSIKTGDIYICRGDVLKRGMKKWLKVIYNAVLRLFLRDNSSGLDLTVGKGGQTVCTQQFTFPSPFLKAESSNTIDVPNHVAAENGKIFARIIDKITNLQLNEGYCITPRRVIVENINNAYSPTKDQSVRRWCQYAIMYDSCVTLHNNPYTKKIIHCGVKRNRSKEINVESKRLKSAVLLTSKNSSLLTSKNSSLPNDV